MLNLNNLKLLCSRNMYCFPNRLIISQPLRFNWRPLVGLKLLLFLHNSLCVCVQDVGNVRGTTAVFAAPRPRPSVTSALARFVGITRWGRSPPPPLKAASVALVTTLSVPWAPTPAWPSHTAPPWVLFGSKRSRRQSWASRLQSDTAAALNTSFPVKCAAVGLLGSDPPLIWSSVLRKGIQSFLISVVAPIQRWDTDEHLDAVCGKSRATGVSAGEVSWHHWRPFFLLFCHETPPIRPSIARLRPIGGPRPPPHYVFCCYFYSCGNFKCCQLPALWRNHEWGSGRGQREDEEKEMWSRTSPPPCCSTPCLPAVRCGWHLTHRMAVRRRASPFLLLRSHSSLPTWSVIVFITFFFFFVEERRGRNDWFCAIFFFSGPHYIPTFLDMVLIYLWV